MTASVERKPFEVWSLIWLQFLLGFGAIVSGGMLMLAPDGSLLQMPLSVMLNSPFPNFFVPGMILCVLLGIFPMCVAYGLWKRPGWNWPDAINPFKLMHWSWSGSLAAGVMVSIWLTVELIWVSIGFLHILYYAWSGLILLITLLPATRKYYQRAGLVDQGLII
jgi:hypothetical protein